MFGVLPVKDSRIFEGERLFQKALEQPNLYGFLLEIPMLDEIFFEEASSGVDVKFDFEQDIQVKNCSLND